MFMVPTMRVIIWIFHFPGCLVAVLIYITPDDECPLEAGSDHVSVTGLWWPRHPCHECHAGPCRHVTGIPPSPAPAARHSNTPTLRHENRQIKWTRSMDSEDIHGHEDILAPYGCQEEDNCSRKSCWCSWSQLRPGVWLQHSLSSHVLDTLAQRSLSLPPARLSDHRSVLSGSQWPMARNHSHHRSGRRMKSSQD